MKRALIIILGAVLTVGPNPAEASPHAETFAKYCVDCHGPTKQKGKVRLDQLSNANADLWESIYEQLASGEMPPDDKPQPTKALREGLAKYALQQANEGAIARAPGLRRLNKREYGNTVRDLLGLSAGIFDPAAYVYGDDIDEGFDTNAESLVISNELLLEYLGAAEKSLHQALFIPGGKKPSVQVRDVSPRKMGGVGGNRYIIKEGNSIICRMGGKGMVFDHPSTRAMKLGGRYRITVTACGTDRENYPVRFTPEKGPIIMGIGVAHDGPDSVADSGKLFQTYELKDDVNQTFTLDIWIGKDYYPYFSFVNGSSKPITQIRANLRRGTLKQRDLRGKSTYEGPGVRISKFKIEGPFYDQWPPRSFKATYDANVVPNLKDRNARGALVLRFAKRAFRRPVFAAEIRPYLAFLNKQYAVSKDWHEAMIRTFSAMMGTVDFLYIREGDGALNDYELASRLSYFFWSTMPDAELFALAKSGKLTDPNILSKQVERMLNDPRADRFCNSFTDQWLALDKLGTMPPDLKGEFRQYYRDDLEPAMREETRRFFRHIMRQNVSVRDFITSDYSFVNAGLANLYGIRFPGDKGFVRVKFPPQAKRGGLLGHASVLTLTSNGVETLPVERGVWVLAELLGTPPPPAPKEVPAITPDTTGANTVRDLLQKHRSDAACMECHRRMDPLGFALEAYGPIGQLRTRYSKVQKVTTHGTYKGQDFADVTELKEILAKYLQPFARSLIVRIAEYAKGRKLVPADFVLVEKIVAASAADKFKLRDMLVRIATSDLMRER